MNNHNGFPNGYSGTVYSPNAVYGPAFANSARASVGTPNQPPQPAHDPNQQQPIPQSPNQQQPAPITPQEAAARGRAHGRTEGRYNAVDLQADWQAKADALKAQRDAKAARAESGRQFVGGLKDEDKFAQGYAQPISGAQAKIYGEKNAKAIDTEAAQLDTEYNRAQMKADNGAEFLKESYPGAKTAAEEEYEYISEANQQAELELNGHPGRLITDPRLPKPLPNQNDTRPTIRVGVVPSIREQIESDRGGSYGRTAAERRATADAFYADIKTLTEKEGFEPSQALVIAEMRLKDRPEYIEDVSRKMQKDAKRADRAHDIRQIDHKDEIAADPKAKGATIDPTKAEAFKSKDIVEAEKKAASDFDRRLEFVKKTMKSKGLYTKADYDHYRKDNTRRDYKTVPGQQPGAYNPNGSGAPTGPTGPTGPRGPEGGPGPAPVDPAEAARQKRQEARSNFQWNTPEELDHARAMREKWIAKTVDRRTQRLFKVRNRVSNDDVSEAFEARVSAHSVADAKFRERASGLFTPEEIDGMIARRAIHVAGKSNIEIAQRVEDVAKKPRSFVARKWAAKGGDDRALGAVTGVMNKLRNKAKAVSSRGKVVKVASLSGVALLAGGIAGYATRREHGVATAAAGAITGAVASYNTVRKLSETLYPQENNDGVSIATAQRERAWNFMTDQVNLARDQDGKLIPARVKLDQLEGFQNKMTAEYAKRNTRRGLGGLAIGLGIGAATAAAMGGLTEHAPGPDLGGLGNIDLIPGHNDEQGTFNEHTNGEGHSPNDGERTPGPEQDKDNDTYNVEKDTYQIEDFDNNFDVSSGDGIENTIVENMPGVNGQEAHDLAVAMKTAGFLTPDHISNASNMNVPGAPNFGYNAVGSTTWSDEALAFARDWLANKR